MSGANLQKVASSRQRIALILTTATMVVYFGFILLVAFNKPLLGTLITSGLSVGIVLGSLVILISWVLTGIYVYWANRHYDVGLSRLSKSQEAA